MAKGINKFKEWIGIGDEVEEEEMELESDINEDEVDEEEYTRPARRVKKSSPAPAFAASKKAGIDASLVVSKPQNFEESKEICDKLKQRKGVYVNLEGLDKILAQRIVDFIGGSVYALEGNIKKVASAGFIVVPDNISIASDPEGKDDDGENYEWLK
jgi:cell division inhibitor SepF